ncbi:MAG: hypothetical protein HYR94_30115 [Chloroflexi bacterium]|nr:hypothetical protein [Chloroflexota bacterium]
MNDDKQAGYHSYLLRLWREGPQDPWRASLQSTATGQLHHFGDLDRLWAFIQAQVAAGSEIEQGPAEPPRQEDL